MTLLLESSWIVIQIFLLWIAADFLTGAVHWWQDAYGNPTWPIIGKYVIQPNLRHHQDPRGMLKTTYWQRMWTSIVTGIALICVFWLCDCASWQLVLLIVFSTQGNEIHAIGHRTNKENGRLIIRLQKIGIIQTRKTHGWHHKAPYDTNFCVMTEFLNPILNKINFWVHTENFILKAFKIPVLRGSPIRGGM